MDPEQQIKWEGEKAERRRLWEQQQKADAEARERQLKQARLEAHLKRRGEAWMDHTGGSLPPSGMLADWQAEYISEQADREERERQRRLDQAAADAVV
jgi:hypothetical protein